MILCIYTQICLRGNARTLLRVVFVFCVLPSLASAISRRQRISFDCLLVGVFVVCLAVQLLLACGGKDRRHVTVVHCLRSLT